MSCSVGSPAMRVAVVSYLFDDPGGAVVAARDLVKSLADSGMYTVVVTTHADGPTTVGTEGGVKIYRFRPKNLYWVGDKDEQPLWKKILWQSVDTWNPHPLFVLRRILRVERPDIVHFFKLRGLSPSVWQAVPYSMGARAVQTCEDYELMSPEGTLSGRLGRWAVKRAIGVRPYQALRSACSRRVAVATAPSRYTLDTITSCGFFPSAHKVVVPNSHGMSASEVSGRRLRSGSERVGGSLRLLFLGRLESIKGVDMLCRCVERLAASGTKVELEVAGWGSLDESLREAYGDNSGITLVGPLFGADKEAALSRCDALVVPSRWPEAFGIVAVEALAFGKPVIATRVGGLEEIVEAGRTGLLIPPADEKALSDALGWAATHREQLRGMADACYARAMEFTRESVAGRYLAAYEHALRTRVRESSARSSSS
jgi:glycosyltransferase involved in cell wall biosynthesis